MLIMKKTRFRLYVSKRRQSERVLVLVADALPCLPTYGSIVAAVAVI